MCHVKLSLAKFAVHFVFVTGMLFAIFVVNEENILLSLLYTSFRYQKCTSSEQESESSLTLGACLNQGYRSTIR